MEFEDSKGWSAGQLTKSIWTLSPIMKPLLHIVRWFYRVQRTFLYVALFPFHDIRGPSLALNWSEEGQGAFSPSLPGITQNTEGLLQQVPKSQESLPRIDSPGV